MEKIQDESSAALDIISGLRGTAPGESLDAFIKHINNLSIISTQAQGYPPPPREPYGPYAYSARPGVVRVARRPPPSNM